MGSCRSCRACHRMDRSFRSRAVRTTLAAVWTHIHVSLSGKHRCSVMEKQLPC